MQQQADIEEENKFMATKSNPTLQESVWVDVGHLADRLVTKPWKINLEFHPSALDSALSQTRWMADSGGTNLWHQGDFEYENSFPRLITYCWLR